MKRAKIIFLGVIFLSGLAITSCGSRIKKEGKESEKKECCTMKKDTLEKKSCCEMKKDSLGKKECCVKKDGVEKKECCKKIEGKDCEKKCEKDKATCDTTKTNK
jgi:hypothetical protein